MTSTENLQSIVSEPLAAPPHAAPYPPPADVRAAIQALESAQTRSYASLKPADALAHLNESLAAEVERFERDSGLRVAALKLKRDMETSDLKALAAQITV